MCGEHSDHAVPSMTYVEVVERVRENVCEMLTGDPVLQGVGVNVPVDLLTAEELDTLIDLEKWQALSVVVERANCTTFKVVVRDATDATVSDLKRAIKMAVTLDQVSLLNLL